MNRIKELPKSSSHLLSSTQIITSIHNVVKELIENSLDGLATSVEVKLDDYGLNKIEVKDNGSGIHRDDVPFMAKPHCTSKIKSHLDLNTIQTYGFRGEALAAICAVSELVVSTKTADDEFGFVYTFDHNGNVMSSKPCSCNQGTTVSALNLFENIPVRKQFYRSDKNKKDEIKKVEDLLISFGIILPKVRLALHHNRNVIWQKPAVNQTMETLQQVLGNPIFDHLKHSTFVDDETQIKIDTYLPIQSAPPFCSQISLSRTIVAINKRPVRMKVIDKLIKEHFNKTQEGKSKPRYPVCLISIELPPAEVDVNFETHKTAVVLRNSESIVAQLSDILSSFYYVDTNTSDATTNELPGFTNGFSSGAQIVSKSSNAPKNFPNTVDVPILSTKLSRKPELKTPLNKRSRTSSDYSTPPNDILRHIKTLNSFFSPLNDDETNKSESDSVSKDNKKDDQSCVLDAASSIVNNHVNLTSLERPPKKRKEDIPIQLLNNYHNVISSSTQRPAINDLTIIPKSLVDEISVLNLPTLNVTNIPKSLVDEIPVLNLPTLNENCRDLVQGTLALDAARLETSLNEKSPVIPLVQTSASESMPGSNEWSRGLQAAMQPVTVLKPKANGDPKIITAEKEIKILKAPADSRELLVSTTNSRKMTPFDLFCRKHRLEVSSMNPEISNQQIAQILSEKWSCLPAEEQNLYTNISSEDSPKAIQNKKTTGERASPKLNSTSLKKPTSKRRKFEKTIIFDMDAAKRYCSNYCSEDQANNSFNLISCIYPGIWICSEQGKLFLLNCFRLQETVIYHRLMESFQFDTESSSIILSPESLGEDAINTLLKLNTATSFGNECNITDERITSNGFKIKIAKEENAVHAELIGLTKLISFYGVIDLKEILIQIFEKGLSAKLSECRPSKVVMYLKGEAVRMARQSPPITNIEDAQDLLQTQETLSSKVCLHSKPFLHELYTLTNQT